MIQSDTDCPDHYLTYTTHLSNAAYIINHTPDHYLTYTTHLSNAAYIINHTHYFVDNFFLYASLTGPVFGQSITWCYTHNIYSSIT